jgi:hypothetical protein
MIKTSKSVGLCCLASPSSPYRGGSLFRNCLRYTCVRSLSIFFLESITVLSFVSLLSIELIVLFGELEARIRLQGRRTSDPSKPCRSSCNWCLQECKLFGTTRMFPRGPFLLNILSFDKGMIHAGGFSSNIFFLDLRGVSTGSPGILYSYMVLNHLFDPQESSIL